MQQIYFASETDKLSWVSIIQLQNLRHRHKKNNVELLFRDKKKSNFFHKLKCETNRKRKLNGKHFPWNNSLIGSNHTSSFDTKYLDK